MKKLLVFVIAMSVSVVAIADAPPEAPHQKLLLPPLPSQNGFAQQTVKEWREKIDDALSLQSGAWRYSLQGGPRINYTDTASRESYELRADGGRITFNYSNGRFSARGQSDRITLIYSIPLN